MSPVDGQGQSPDEDFDATTESVLQRPVAPRQFNDVSAPAPEPQPIKATEVTPEVAPVEPIADIQGDAHIEQEQPVAPPAAAPVAPVTLENPKVKRALPLRLAAEALLIAAIVGLGVYSYGLQSENAEIKSQLTAVANNPQLAVERQTKTQIAKVGQLMQLPADEEPTVANVSNAAQAKAQSAFFNNAQNGDTVLMYVKSGQAILYRPTTNRIILVAPLTFDSKAAATTTTPPATR